MAQAKVLERKVFYTGDTIFRQGDEGNCAYLIQEGEIEIFQPQRDGTARVLGTIGKGSIFGEMALIDDQPRMASAVAKDTTTVVLINRQQFTERVQSADPFVRGLLNILAQNVRAMTNK